MTSTSTLRPDNESAGGPLRVAGYLRKSRITMRDRRVKDRAAEQGISASLASLAIQREDIEESIRAERDGRPRVIVGFFTDIISGARADRTGRDTIYAMTQRGEVDEVWVWAFDRWSREDEAEAMATLVEMRRLGRESPAAREVGVLSVQEDYIDWYGDRSRYNADVFAAFQRAKFERERLMERSGRGLVRAKAEGTHLGLVPFGFRAVRGDLHNGIEPVPEKAATIVQIFEMRAEGRSLKSIQQATGLAETTIHFLLHGAQIKTRTVSAEHLARIRAVVGDDLYQRAQIRTPGRTFDTTPRWPWLLRGLIFCPTCGRRMLGHRSAKKRKDGTWGYATRLYVCSDRRIPHPRRSIKEDAVLAPIEYALDGFVLDPDHERRVLDLARSPERKRRVVNYAKRLSDLESERREIERAWRARRRTFEWWEVEDERLEREIAELRALQSGSVEEGEIVSKVVALRNVYDVLRHLDRDDVVLVGLVNDMLREMIERVTIDEDWLPTVRWTPAVSMMLGAAKPRLRVVPEPPQSAYVSAYDVSRELGINRTRIRRMLRAGEIPGHVEAVGDARYWRIPATWLRDQKPS